MSKYNTIYHTFCNFSIFTMVITFVDGVKKMYNAHPLLEKKIYEPLKNISFFLTAKVVGDTMGWNDDVDIAPEFLYENSIEI